MDFNSSGGDVYISMSAESFAAVNVPLSAVGILPNMFFIFCMVFPPQGAEPMKPLLKVLLGSLVGCNTVIHVCIIFIVFYVFVLCKVVLDWYTFAVISDLVLNVMLYIMMNNVACCHWTNMFYFCQIVPPQHPFLIWFKRNMRALVYSGLVFNAILDVFGITVDVAHATVQLKHYNAYNISVETENALWNSVLIFDQIKLADFWTRLILLWLSVCVMFTSSFVTVLYLWRHMKNVEESGISSPRLQRQIKLIISCITVQTLLHFLCLFWILIDEVIVKYFGMSFDLNEFILYTIISLYAFGTTINMGICQSLFRQGARHVWQIICQNHRF